MKLVHRGHSVRVKEHNLDCEKEVTKQTVKKDEVGTMYEFLITLQQTGCVEDMIFSSPFPLW